MKIDDDIDGFVLAGGASSRMGRPKHALLLGGRSLAERAVSIMSALTGERVTIVGNDIDGGIGEIRVKLVPDDTRAFAVSTDERRAPIFGLYTALSLASTGWIAVLAVDLPFVSGELLARLASMRSDETDAIVPVQPDGRLQPLCAMYRRDTCSDAVSVAIETGELSLHKLLGGVRVRRVVSSEITDLPGSENFFVNVNAPDDLQAAAKLLENSRVVL
ncbi:MAG: molybdenum cofactor guanylyltransferase [Pyrinomonadaceae bacterium]